MNRREFLIKTGAATAGCVLGGLSTTRAASTAAQPAMGGRGVAIVCDPVDPVVAAGPVKWAAEQLRQALTQRGVAAKICARLGEANPTDICVVATGGASAMARDGGLAVPAEAESLAIASGRLGQRDVLMVGGRDVRGLVYALTELADAVAHGDEPDAVLHPTRAVVERPANAVRSVMRMIVSKVEDKPWFTDREFWRRYLSLLVTQRFNRFNLALGLGYDRVNNVTDTYFYFAYPFLVKVPGYDVRATNLPDAERDANLAMLRFISDEAAARGLQFQLGIWTHAYTWINSPNATHVIEGLTPQTQATYSRDALALVLKECPNITGVTFRIHGESGVAEGNYDLWKTIFDGCVRSGRRLNLDMHAKGMDEAMVNTALGTGLPVTISPKYWAEHLGLPYHQAAIRATELPKREKGSGLYAQSEGARSFLRYGYGDLLNEERRFGIVHRIWPGTQRVLQWGDPAFAAAYGRAMSFCGSLGCEIFDPLSFKGREGSGLPNNGGRDGYVDAAMRPAGGDFEKFAYTYRLWGRMLYNPDAAPDTWQRKLRADHGPAAAAVEAALANASRVLPLVTTAWTPSASNLQFWPEMAVNMSIVDESGTRPYGETPAPRRFGTASPLDPQLFMRAEEFADQLLKNEASGKYSPVEVAQWLEDFAQTASDSLAAAATQAADRNAPVFRRVAIDVTAQLELGRFYAKKFRAAVLYGLYLRTGEGVALEEAINVYRMAREAWARLAQATTGVYVSDLTYTSAPHERGLWADRLPAIERDIALMEKQRSVVPAPAAKMPGVTPERVAALVREVVGRPQRSAAGVAHVPPKSFRRGQPVALELTAAGAAAGTKTVQLYYRRTHQAEAWRTVAMEASGGGFRAAIPGDYTDAPFPLEYYFEVATPGAGRPTIYPGLGAKLCDQPYFVVRA